MKAKLLIEGIEIEVEISESEIVKLPISKIAELTIKEPNITNTTSCKSKKNGYERCLNEVFYYVDCDDYVEDYTDFNEDKSYDCANYYSDKSVAKNNARADALMRRLRRFAVQHRKTELNWKDEEQPKYIIYYNHLTNTIDYECMHTTEYSNAIYFDSVDSAMSAISYFCDDLVWYFTEYKDSL